MELGTHSITIYRTGHRAYGYCNCCGKRKKRQLIHQGICRPYQGLEEKVRKRRIDGRKQLRFEQRIFVQGGLPSLGKRR